jgi:hypothetical protein
LLGLVNKSYIPALSEMLALQSALGLIAVFSTIDLNIMRSSEKNGKSRKSAFVQNSMQNAPQEGLNWVVILGGTIASALSVTLGRKLKQALENNRQRDTKELNEPGICCP